MGQSQSTDLPQDAAETAEFAEDFNLNGIGNSASGEWVSSWFQSSFRAEKAPEPNPPSPRKAKERTTNSVDVGSVCISPGNDDGWDVEWEACPPPWGDSDGSAWRPTIPGEHAWDGLLEREVFWWEAAPHESSRNLQDTAHYLRNCMQAYQAQEAAAWKKRRKRLQSRLDALAVRRDQLAAGISANPSNARKVQHSMSLAKEEMDAVKRELYFPAINGYKHRLGMDGVYMAFGDFSLEHLQASFHAELLYSNGKPYLSLAISEQPGEALGSGAHGIMRAECVGLRNEAVNLDDSTGMLSVRLTFRFSMQAWFDRERGWETKEKPVLEVLELARTSSHTMVVAVLPDTLLRWALNSILPNMLSDHLVRRLPAILGEYAAGAGQDMKLSFGIEMAGPPFAELDAPLTGDERASAAARARLRVSLPQAHALQACCHILCSALAEQWPLLRLLMRDQLTLASLINIYRLASASEAARTALVALVVRIVEIDNEEGRTEGRGRAGLIKKQADAFLQTLDQLDCLPVRLILQAHKMEGGVNVHAVLEAITASMQSRWPSAAKEAFMLWMRRWHRSLSTSLRRASLTVQARAHRHSIEVRMTECAMDRRINVHIPLDSMVMDFRPNFNWTVANMVVSTESIAQDVAQVTLMVPSEQLLGGIPCAWIDVHPDTTRLPVQVELVVCQGNVTAVLRVRSTTQKGPLGGFPAFYDCGSEDILVVGCQFQVHRPTASLQIDLLAAEKHIAQSQSFIQDNRDGAHSASPSHVQVAEAVTINLGTERGGTDSGGGVRIVGHEGVSMHFECPLVRARMRPSHMFRYWLGGRVAADSVGLSNARTTSSALMMAAKYILCESFRFMLLVQASAVLVKHQLVVYFNVKSQSGEKTKPEEIYRMLSGGCGCQGVSQSPLFLSVNLLLIDVIGDLATMATTTGPCQ